MPVVSAGRTDRRRLGFEPVLPTRTRRALNVDDLRRKPAHLYRQVERRLDIGVNPSPLGLSRRHDDDVPDAVIDRMTI